MARLAPGRDLDAQKNLFDELSLVGDVDLMDYGTDMSPWAMMRVGGVARHSEYNLQEAGAIFRRDGRGSDCSPGTPRLGLLHENMILDRA